MINIVSTITYASCITLLRILLAPVIMYFIVQHMWINALWLFLVAAATDLLDGYVARRFGQQSTMGKFLDPLADKILLMGSMYTLLLVIPLEWWQQWGVSFLILKELVLLVGAAVLKLKYNMFIAPSFLSRLVGLFEFCLVIMLLVSLGMLGSLDVGVTTIVLICNIAASVWLLCRYGFLVYHKVTYS